MNKNSQSSEISSSPSKVFYQTTSICPYCNKILPAEMVGKSDGVFVSRVCPEHGLLEGLACSDVEWFEALKKFDVEPATPSFFDGKTDKGCPQDCGLCPSHRQSAGTAAIEVSNSCNMACPVCLADNKSTFELSAGEVKKIADDFLGNQKKVDAFTLSGGEPTIHPHLFDIIKVLERAEISRIVINSNGKRIAQDDTFLDQLAKHTNVYVSLHHDGPSAEKIRGVPYSMQEKALERLIKWGIPVVPLVLGVKNTNSSELGEIISGLLTKSTAVKSVIISLMAYCGSRGSTFKIEPKARLTIPEALDCIETSTKGNIKKSDFMPLPMPNPMCASIGYFVVAGNEITPLISLMDIDRVIEFVKNAHFVNADRELELLLKETIDRIYANLDKFNNSAKLLSTFKSLLKDLYPEGRNLSTEERKKIAEERIKTVYLMQFMDAWTFDSVRLSKCSCQHLLPDKKIVPSCGYYAYHRKFDNRFVSQTQT